MIFMFRKFFELLKLKELRSSLQAERRKRRAKKLSLLRR